MKKKLKIKIIITEYYFNKIKKPHTVPKKPTRILVPCGDYKSTS